jgi:hypothetical protein
MITLYLYNLEGDAGDFRFFFSFSSALLIRSSGRVGLSSSLLLPLLHPC